MISKVPSRRIFLQAATSSLGLTWAQLKGFSFTNNSSSARPFQEPKGSQRLFPPGLSSAAWHQFNAAGYARPVTGIIYRTHAVSYFSAYMERPMPVSGMPLGAIDTGGLYLDPCGVLGYSSIFNHITPAGGPLNTPYLGVGVGGKTWVLATGQTKNYAEIGRAHV